MAKVCPNCNSGRIRLTARNYRGKSFGSHDLYICVDCSHSFPEPVEPKIKEEEEETKADEEAAEDE